MTDSEFVKQEIISRLRVAPGKIHVVPLGISTFSEPDKRTEQQLLAKLGVQTEYILTVGSFYQHKNFDQLVSAFDIVRKHLPSRSLSLVLVGRKVPDQPDAYEKVWSEVRALGLAPHTIFAGAVSDMELGLLYRRAAVFVLPSLYEGFGFPVLEAMIYGVPVVVSNAGSLPEIVGNYGVLCDPHFPQSIGNAIEKVLIDQDFRRHLTIGGIKRARVFSWENTARRVVEILESV
jgi:glycosyltransferase involved in cell wall biosynthesis